MRAFPVRLPSGARYWTVIDEDLAVVGEADEFLRQVRFGRDGSELTTRAYAGAIALYLRWCGRTGRSWQAGLEQLALFVTWLRHVPVQAAAADAGPGGAGEVVAGPGGCHLNMLQSRRRAGLDRHGLPAGAQAGSS
jgi:integrase/recombinase XerD